MIDYSVIIRTTGNAGEKYASLLNSISKLNDKPREVIVVLPEGYAKPKEKIGNELFYYCKKGMVTQRLYGIEKCKTKYALICDDDVCFESDFIEKLHQPISDGIAELSAGPLLSFLPAKGIMSILHAVTGSAVPMINNRGRYISILSTTGYSYNRYVTKTSRKYLTAESLPWTCFYGDVEAIKRIAMEEEHWLELNGYASLDDQTMFYKAYLRGIRTVIVPNAHYKHLDAKTSRRVLSDIAYSMEFNRYVFWHRFIYSMDSGVKKIWDQICIDYYFFMKFFYNRMRLISKELDIDAVKAKKQAIKDAKKYVKSKEYLNLPKVI